MREQSDMLRIKSFRFRLECGGKKQFLALRENIAHFVLVYVCESEKERLEVTSESGRKIEFEFEFSLANLSID